MSRRYFLADIHLSAARPDITAAFRRALAYMAAQQPDGIYILGDLFNVWQGDDLADAFALDIAQELARLPCPVYFQHGNRDFLLGKAFAQHARLILIAERHIFTTGGQRVLLEHGDLLCIHDRGYLRLRRLLRNKRLQQLYFRLPTRVKRYIARQVQSKSKARSTHKAPHITDVDSGEVRRVLMQYQADILIHGHTHRPACYDEHGYTRYVLGDWSAQGGIIVEYDGGQWRQYRLPL